MTDATDKPRRKGAGRVAFLAHLEGIKSRLREDHHPQIWVYEEYKKRLCEISYSQFNRYVRKFIDDEHQKGKQRDRSPTKESSEPKKTEETKPTNPDGQTESSKPNKPFHFDPEAKREDLI